MIVFIFNFFSATVKVVENISIYRYMVLLKCHSGFEVMSIFERQMVTQISVDYYESEILNILCT